MKLRPTLGFVGPLAMLGLFAILIVVLLRSEADRLTSRALDIPMLTIEETVGLAFYAGTPPCVVRRANPEARITLFKILSDPAHSSFHLQVANCLGYVCQSPDIDAIEDEIERRAAMPASLSAINNKNVVSALCMTLAVMDHRKVEGAADALRSMASERYWNDLGAVWYPPGGIKAGMTDADIYRCGAIVAYGWTGRRDVEDVVSAALANTTGGRRRLLEVSIQSRLKDARDSKDFFTKPCDEETNNKWVNGLRKCWNNDLDNPLPTASRRFPAED